MDIDDILASVSTDTHTSQRLTDLQALTRAWVTERCAPELLPYPGELIDRVMERIRLQVRQSYFLTHLLHSFLLRDVLIESLFGENILKRGRLPRWSLG